MVAAQVREACGIPGTSVRATWLCRDKPVDEGGRCARLVSPRRRRRPRPTTPTRSGPSPGIGYPLILKPRAGAGRPGHGRVDSDTDLAHAITVLAATGATSIAVEEFVEGHEGFYDTIARTTGSSRLDHALLPQRPGGDAHPLDLAAVHHHQPGWPTPPSTPRSPRTASVIEALGRRRPPTWNGSTDQGPALLRKSVVAHRVSDVGTCMPRATMSTSTASGQTSSPGSPIHAMTRLLPPASLRCVRTGTVTSPATRGSGRSRRVTVSGSSTATSRRSATSRSPSRPGYMANA